jgi:hypothetical protein
MDTGVGYERGRYYHPSHLSYSIGTTCKLVFIKRLSCLLIDFNVKRYFVVFEWKNSAYYPQVWGNEHLHHLDMDDFYLNFLTSMSQHSSGKYQSFLNILIKYSGLHHYKNRLISNLFKESLKGKCTKAQKEVWWGLSFLEVWKKV